MGSQAVVTIERVQQVEPGGRAVYHGCGDRVIEYHHGIRRHTPQQFVKSEDLWPIGVFGPRRFVVNRGNGGLQLVSADRALRERGRENGARTKSPAPTP